MEAEIIVTCWREQNISILSQIFDVITNIISKYYHYLLLHQTSMDFDHSLDVPKFFSRVLLSHISIDGNII